jgi:3-oxoacyl-[acyl-carrier-protein] synthase-3
MAHSIRPVLTSLGHFHPQTTIDNSFFDKLDIGSNGAWVEDRTGIRSRHSVLSEAQICDLKNGRVTLDQLRQDKAFMCVADMSSHAWHMVKQRASLVPELDLVTCGTSVPDFDIPANAATIANAIASNATSYDINSACSSFVVNLHHARAMIQASMARNVAVFVPERYSLRLDYTDRSGCVLFGDGCAAALIEADGASGLEILDTMVVSSPSKCDLVTIPVSGTFHQNGAAVQKFAITRTIEITLAILQRNHLSLSDVSYLVAHQANLRMLTSAVDKLGIDSHRHLYNVDEFGNQGAAGAPCALSKHWDQLQSGDVVVMSVVGSGLTWASALFRKI